MTFEPQTIGFFRNEYHYLSNFWLCQVILDGQLYSSSEHAFQAMKTIDPAERDHVREAKDPGEAKRRGRKVTMRPDWDAVCNDAMEYCLRQKFSSLNPELVPKLINTHPKYLREGNSHHDNKWGDCICGRCANISGQNRLGILLMKVREDLVHGRGHAMMG